MSVWGDVKSFLGGGLPAVLDTPQARYAPQQYAAFPERYTSAIGNALRPIFQPSIQGALASEVKSKTPSTETLLLIAGGLVVVLVVLRARR